MFSTFFRPFALRNEPKLPSRSVASGRATCNFGLKPHQTQQLQQELAQVGLVADGGGLAADGDFDVLASGAEEETQRSYTIHWSAAGTVRTYMNTFKRRWLQQDVR